MTKKTLQKKGRYFSTEEQHQIIQEMIFNGCTKKEIWRKYTGQEEEHGQLLRWMKKLGYSTADKRITITLARNTTVMSKRKKSEIKANGNEASHDKLQLKQRIFELEKQLKDAEHKAIAFSTMVDLAEQEFNIPIRKKYNTKP